MATSASVYTYKHIVVVHGIGDQKPNETALGFMNEFVRALPRQKGRYVVDVFNLIENVDEATRLRPAFFIFRDLAKNTHHVIGFSEVYWQPVMDEQLAKNHGQPPIPVFTWAHSINARLLDRPERVFHRAREVMDNLERMLSDLKKLAAIYKKSGQLASMLDRFLGDVQMYAESDSIRQQVNERFLRVMARVKRFSEEVQGELLTRKFLNQGFDDFNAFDAVQIYVVAHSEGTVVSLNSLVQAAVLAEGQASHPEREFQDLFEFEKTLCATRGLGAEPASQWLPQVAALATLGSPIDKHYTIWENRFRKDHLKQMYTPSIQWFNYWDLSDPVGYGLREVFKGACTDARKLFTVEYDQGFSRYPIPGKAHVDYWTDPELYRHLISHAMQLSDTEQQPTLGSRWFAWLLRPLDTVSYVLVRVVTLVLGLKFLNRLLGAEIFDSVRPLGQAVVEATRQWPADDSLGSILVWLLAPLLVVKFLRKAVDLSVDRRMSRGETNGKWEPAEDFSYSLSWTLALLWSVFAVLICLGYSQPHSVGAQSGPAVKDLVGYLIGLAVTILAWRLHTTVHKGLIQMWHYTKGETTRLDARP